MKAVRLHDYGSADMLRFEDAPEPVLQPDDVLIRVVGSSVNPVDWKIRQGHLKSMLSYPMPFIPGWDASGVVERVGPQVTRFKVGDSVYTRPDIARDGCYAQFVAVRESEVAFKPKTISHIEAGVLPLAGITAWEALVTLGRIEAGQRVLIHAAAGGVGSLAVQLAKSRGAHVVATASAANRALVESLGADEFIDYHLQPLATATRDIQLVFDTVGGATQQASWEVMSPGGLLVSVIGPPPEDHARALGLRSAFLFIQPNAAVLEELGLLVDAGTLRPLVGAEFALADIRHAHALSETGRSRGKIALYVGTP